MKKLGLLILLVFCLVLQNAAMAKVFRVAVDEHYPPFSYLDKKTNLMSGFDVDIALALCADAGLECEIVPLPFEKIIPSVAEGSIDIGIAGLGKTEERAKIVSYSNRYFRSRSVFIGIPGSVTIGHQELKGKRIAAQKGSEQEAYVKYTYGDVAEIVGFVGFDEMLVAIKEKSVDVAFVEGLPVYSALMSVDNFSIDFIGEPVDHGDGDSYIILNPALKEERELINKGIDNIRASGEYDKINRNYFNFNIY